MLFCNAFRLPDLDQLNMKPVVKVKQRSYQPSKAELTEMISISTTPERLAKAAVSDVIVKIKK